MDVCLPGDVIGIDGVLPSQTLAEVMTFITSVPTKVIDTEGGLTDLMNPRSTDLLRWLAARPTAATF